MAEPVAELFVKITPDTKGFDTKLKEGTEKAGNNMSGTLKKVAGIAVAAFAGTQVISLGKGMVDAASNMAESVSKANVVFGEQAGAIQDWAKSAATNLGQSNQQALEAVGTFGNLFQAFGLSRAPAADMSKGLVQLAADLASFNNASPEDTLLALRSGLSGEAEPLKRFGVALTQDRIELEALSMGLISNTKEALTPAQKAQAAYSLIMKDTALAQGDFARTSDGLANKQRILSSKIKDTKARLGAALLPAVLTVVSAFADKLLPALERAGTWLGNKIPKAIEFLKPWVTLIVDGIKGLIGAFKDGDRTSDGFVGVMERIGIAIRKVFDFIMNNKEILVGILAAIGIGFLVWAGHAAAAAAATLAAAAPFIAIAAGVAALVAGFIYAYKHWEGFRKAVDAVVQWMKNTAWPALQAVFKAIVAAVREVVRWFQRNWDDIANIIMRVVGVIKGIIEAIVGWFQRNSDDIARIIRTTVEVIVNIVKGIIATFKAVFDVVIGIVKNVVGKVLGFWERFGDDIIRYLEMVWDTVSGVFQAAFDVIMGIFEFFKDLFTGKWGQLWDDIVGIFGAIWDGIKAIFQGAIDGLIALLGLAWETIKLAIATAWDAIKALFPLIWEGIKAAVQLGVDALLALLGLAWDTVKAAVGLAWDAIKTVISTAIDAIVGFVVGIGERIASFVSTMWDGIKDGITAAKDWVGDRISDIVDFVTGLPGRFAAGVSRIFGAIMDDIDTAKQWVSDRIGEVVGFVTGLPGQIATGVTRIFGAVMDDIDTAKQWVSDRLGEIVGFFTDMPGKIKTAASGMWDGIKEAFKGAINAIIRFWNGLEFSLPSFKVFGKEVGGFTLGTPKIKEMVQGGIARVNRPYVTSELGPELITPGRTGRITSFEDLVNLITGRTPAIEPAVIWPERVTLIVEGQPLTAIVQRNNRDLAAAIAAGRR